MRARQLAMIDESLHSNGMIKTDKENAMATKAAKTTTKADKLLRDALKLPAADRADIASCLYGSLKEEKWKRDA